MEGYLRYIEMIMACPNLDVEDALIACSQSRKSYSKQLHPCRGAYYERNLFINTGQAFESQGFEKGFDYSDESSNLVGTGEGKVVEQSTIWDTLDERRLRISSGRTS